MTFEEYWKSTGLDVGFEDCAKDAARGAWDSRVPEGYALVPVEPTEKMIEASGAWNKGDAYSYYKAMIKAAQEEE